MLFHDITGYKLNLLLVERLDTNSIHIFFLQHSQTSSSSRRSTLRRTTTGITKSHAPQQMSGDTGMPSIENTWCLSQKRRLTPGLNPLDSARLELILNVPSVSRTRSKSYTRRTSVSSENGSSTPDISEYSHRSPSTMSSGGPLEHKDSILTLVPSSQTPPSQSRQNSEESAARALLLQYFREQTLVDINGFTWEESNPDSSYTSHVW